MKFDRKQYRRKGNFGGIWSLKERITDSKKNGIWGKVYDYSLEKLILRNILEPASK